MFGKWNKGKSDSKTDLKSAGRGRGKEEEDGKERTERKKSAAAAKPWQQHPPQQRRDSGSQSQSSSSSSSSSSSLKKESGSKESISSGSTGSAALAATKQQQSSSSKSKPTVDLGRSGETAGTGISNTTNPKANKPSGASPAPVAKPDAESPKENQGDKEKPKESQGDSDKTVKPKESADDKIEKPKENEGDNTKIDKPKDSGDGATTKTKVDGAIAEVLEKLSEKPKASENQKEATGSSEKSGIKTDSAVSEKPAASSEIKEKDVASSEIKEKVAASSEIKEKEKASSEIKEKEKASSEIKEKEVASLEIKEKEVISSENKEKARSAKPDVQILVGGETVEKSVSGENFENPTGSAETREKPSGSAETREKPTGSAETREKPVAAVETKQPILQSVTQPLRSPSPLGTKRLLPSPLKQRSSSATSPRPPLMPLAAVMTHMEEEDFDLPVILDPKTPGKTLMAHLELPKNVENVIAQQNGAGKNSNSQMNSQLNNQVNPIKKSASASQLERLRAPNGKQNGRCPSPSQTAAVAALGKTLGHENGGGGGMDSSTESVSMDQILRDEANFIQNVSQFYNQEALSDVVLILGEEKFYSHRFVLAKSSEFFRTMLYERGWNDQSSEVVLDETPECQAVFDKFLRYLYTAEISISTMSAVGILCLADKYFVSSLKELCCQYMIENSRSPRTRNALTWYSWAKALHLDPLINQCTETIAWNFHEIITSPEWINMDVEFVYSLFSCSQLVVPNEYALWNALSAWLLQESRSRELKENTERLLPLIRFPMLMVGQLYALEQGELAQRDECHDLLFGLLSKAYRFRALCPSQTTLTSVRFDDAFFQPRDYTDLTVDNVRIQNTLRFGIQVDVKTYRGSVPSEARDAEWKLTYRKQLESWSLQLYAHETAMINGEARIQATVIMYNEQEKVIQVHREPLMVCARGATTTISLSVDQPHLARNMAVLIKPTAL